MSMSRDMPEKVLRVVAPRGYPWRFNGPRRSSHDVRITNYLPLNKVRQSFDGLTVFSPTDTLGVDIIHAFNRVPLNRLPYVIGFESHLPRVFGIEHSMYERLLFRELSSDRCRRIVAISEYAARNFREGLVNAPITAEAKASLLARLEVRYPNLDVPAECVDLDLAEPIEVTFVGNHFARKGGCTVARMAELSAERRLPIHFNIISSVQCGGAIWTDPERDGFYDQYRALLTLPNVSHLANLPNTEVQALLARSHFSLLPTFGDTFGFSVLESMTVGTPVIATGQAAIPEIIEDGTSGILLDPALTPGNSAWIWPFAQRGKAEFEALFAENVDRLASAALEAIESIMSRPDDYLAMRRAAHSKVQRQFASTDASRYWDQLYRQCLSDERADDRARSHHREAN